MEDETNYGQFNTSDEQENDNSENAFDDSDESIEELRERLAIEAEARKKAEEVANNYKIRAEKAEKVKKVVQPSATEKTNSDLSSTDLYAMMKNNVELEDFSDVTDYAKFKGISVQEALATGFVKTLLSEKAGQRNIANATNTGSARRGTARLSDEAIVDNVNKGILPESDEDIMRYVKARSRK